MTPTNSPFTVTTLMAAASQVLEDADFMLVDRSVVGQWKATVARVYEDAYSIVCIAVYETWKDLSFGWTEDQATLVGLISEHFERNEPKTWDGYLVLLTPSVVPTNEHLNAINIQKNTLYLRKLLATGDELRYAEAVRRTLLPLLPLKEYDALQPRNVLDSLPCLLTTHGVEEEVVSVAIAAFRDQRPIVSEIHAFITKARGLEP